MTTKAWPDAQYVFMPEDEALSVEEAVMGVRSISLFIADQRQMYRAIEDVPDSFNAFHVENWGYINVPHMCKLTGTNPELVQKVHQHYLAHELEDPNLSPREKNNILMERRQIITDLFPFNQLRWWKKIPHPRFHNRDIMAPIGVHQRREIVHDPAWLHVRCIQSIETNRAIRAVAS